MSTRKMTWLSRALLLAVFVLGLGLRLYDLYDPPLDFHATRQLHSAMIARGMFYQEREGVQPWKQEMAVQQWRSEGQIEPFVMETLAMWGYRLAGGAFLWIPRFLAIAFWMLGSIFVYLLTRELAGRVAALVAFGFFLVWPYGVVASRSFQPESLYVALTAVALWAAFRWDAADCERADWNGARMTTKDRQALPAAGRPGWLAGLFAEDGWALLAGLLAGMAIYVKLTAAFFLVPPLAVLVLRRGLKPALRSRAAWMLAVLAVLPAAVYHLDGLFGSGFLRSQLAGRFYPEMWVDPVFYLRWISVLERLAPVYLVLAALLGLFLIGDARRPALLALWGGYAAFGLALSHHISTHDYYHLVIMIPLSLGLGAIAGLMYAHLQGSRFLALAASVTLLCAGLVLTAYDARNVLKRNDYHAEVTLWQTVGVLLGPDSKTVALVDDYGGRLKYWGWTNPLIWPTVDDIRWQARNGVNEDFATRFERLAKGQDYFLVSPLSELEQQPELARALNEYLITFQASDLRIYDLRR